MKVAVAVITDAEQQVLITRRPFHVAHGGLWEFPGGKLKEHETAPFALVREIKEELNIGVLASEYLGAVTHAYAHQTVSLLVYHVTDFKGKPECCEGQLALQWVPINNLPHFEFPAANLEIIKLLDDIFVTADK